MAIRLIEISKLPLKTVKGHSNNTTNTKEGTDGQLKIRIHHCDMGLFVIFINNDRET